MDTADLGTDLGAFDFDAGTSTTEDVPNGPPTPIPAAEIRQTAAAGPRLVPATDDPGMANRAAALAEKGDDLDQPLMTMEPESAVTLLVGTTIDGHLVRDAIVREMNGADEEAISKSLTAGNITRFTDVIVKRAVESVGPLTKGTDLDRALDKMLVGDRDMLVLAVRRATYGDSVDLDVTCPHCAEKLVVRYVLKPEADGGDVPVRTIADCPDITEDDVRARAEFPVELPSGREAIVRLLDGSAQKVIFTPDNEEKSSGELNTLLLRECVVSLDGKPVRGIAAVRENLSMRDRNKLLNFLLNNQPGPRYEEVVQECDECKREFPLVLDVLTMFRIV